MQVFCTLYGLDYKDIFTMDYKIISISQSSTF